MTVLGKTQPKYKDAFSGEQPHVTAMHAT